MKKHLLLIICAFWIVNAEAISIEKPNMNSMNEITNLADCTAPSVDYEVISDCEHGEQFLIDVVVNDLGSAGSVVVSDDMGSTPQTLTEPGTISFGPYPNQVEVHVTVADEEDSSCEDVSDVLTQLYCGGEPISVDDSYTAQELVEDVLFDNPCAMVSNITSSTGVDFSDGTPGMGYFESGDNSGLSVTSGIILSTGDVNNTPGPEQTHSDGTSDWPGDDDIDDLNTAQGSSSGSHNATVLEFDFIPFTDHISFDYLFASHEYGTYQCSFADTFAFFLTGEDGNTSNLAVVPGTDIPVSVTNVRDGLYHETACADGNPDSYNEEYFDKYYGTPNGLPPEADPISFRGYTVKLTAEADVNPGETYHIKLVIADYSDTAFDSAVFLQAGSFDIGEIDLGPDMTIENQNAPCEESSAILDSGIPEDEFVEFSWYKDNELIEGEEGPTLEVSESGEYQVIALYGGSCVVDDGIVVEFAPLPEFDFDGEDASLCGVDSVVLDGTPANIDEFSEGAIYTWYVDGTEIPGETGSIIEVDQAGTYEVEVASGSGCFGSHVFEVTDASFEIDLGEDMLVTSLDGIVLDATPIGEDPDSVTYEWELDGEAIPEDGPIVNPEDYGFGLYSVTVSGEDGECSASDSVLIEADTTCEVSLSADNDLTGTLGFCEGATDVGTYEITFTADFTVENGEGDISYTWFVNENEVSGETGQSYTHTYDSEGEYNDIISVEAEMNGCIATAELETHITIAQFDTPCKISEGISPGNNDGMNDNLDLTFLNDRSGIEKITIYNRYGTKVFSQNDYSDQWYGQDDSGKELPSATYYYVIKLKNDDPIFDRVIKGWVYVNQKVN